MSTDENTMNPGASQNPPEKKWEKVAEKAEQEINDEPKNEANTQAAQPEAINTPSHEELINKINELEVNQDKMVRLLAEKENSIRRGQAELEKANKFAVTKLAQELLQVIDSLELSLQAVKADDESLKSFREGIEMTLKMLLTTLEKYGVKVVNPLNEKFDPNFHEAISMQEHPEAPAGTVLNVLQKGYLLHERLIRPAMVIVAKAAESTKA